jgi:single-strand DNA-binding protein
VNVVTLVGNLATDVDLRDVGTGSRIATFTLAVDRPAGGETADFIRVAVWNRLAESCHEHLGKGSRVALDGRLRSRTWDDDGKRRTAVEVVANHVEFLSRRDGEVAAAR